MEETDCEPDGYITGFDKNFQGLDSVQDATMPHSLSSPQFAGVPLTSSLAQRGE